MIIQVVDIDGKTLFEMEVMRQWARTVTAQNPAYSPLSGCSRKPGRSHVARSCRGVQPRQDIAHGLAMLGVDASFVAGSMNRLSALLLKFRIMANRNMHYVTCQRERRCTRIDLKKTSEI